MKNHSTFVCCSAYTHACKGSHGARCCCLVAPTSPDTASVGAKYYPQACTSCGSESSRCNGGAGDVGQEIKSEDEDALFAHPSQLALQETIADMEQADRLAHAPDRNFSPQDANLTRPKRHLSPRNRHLGPYDTDHGPRARDPQKQDLDRDTRHLSTHDRCSQKTILVVSLECLGRSLLNRAIRAKHTMAARGGSKMVRG